jgi:hypothetical protein
MEPAPSLDDLDRTVDRVGVIHFDATRIIERGRKRLASRAFQTLRAVQQKP